MIDGQDVDPIVADDVEHPVGKAAQRCSPDSRMRFRVGLGLALDAGEAGVHRLQKRAAKTWQASFVPTKRVV
jgi:hypothetical protein